MLPPSPGRLVEVTRGSFVESFHDGAIAVCDAGGHVLVAVGDPAVATNIRSAAKPWQALPLVSSGAATSFGLDDRDIAIAAGSHLGEPFHVERVAALLQRGGFAESDLRCGPHWPFHEEAAERLRAVTGQASPLHNNCSGKHAGILLACRVRGWDAGSYWEADHPAQREILEELARDCGVAPAAIGTAPDGCSLPSFHLPIAATAAAYARLLAAAEEDNGSAASPRARVVNAMRARPEFVRGSGSLTTLLMRAAGGRILAKEGAEASYALGIPSDLAAAARAALGLPGAPGPLGVFLKLFDGGSRGREAVVLEVLAQMDLLPVELPAELAAMRRPQLTDWRGDGVGEVRPVFRLRAR